MTEPRTPERSLEAAAFQNGDRVPAITPEGLAMNKSISEVDRVTAGPKSVGAEGENWQSDAAVADGSDGADHGVDGPENFPATRVHEGGDPALDGDAQYGASPIRSARYDENHEANADMAGGKLRSGHHGGQARYPNSRDQVKGPSGHDEQQQSRNLAQNGR